MMPSWRLLQLSAICLPVFFTLEAVQGEGVKYLGCFQDQEENRLLSEVKVWSAAQSISSCADTCLKGGYPFAGTQQSSECFCGYSRPPLVARRPDSECSKPCSGDAKLQCGGDLRLSVYTTGVTEIGSLPSGFHLGCFKDYTGLNVQRVLPDLHQEFNSLTPKICSEFCFKKGFMLSGVQNGKDCHCSNKRLDSKMKTLDSECKTQCVGDNAKVCGASQRLNVYATGLTDISATGRMVACFDDSPDENGQLVRALPDFKAELRQTNSPRTCVNICYQMGFNFAGLEAGFECFCGVWQPDEAKAKSDSECNIACEGSPGEECGGHWRLRVYKTPLLDTEKEEFSLSGCYHDQNDNRILTGLKEWSAELTITDCVVNLCGKRGYPYAGIHGSSECFCGHSKPPLLAARPDEECAIPCSGNSEQKCGGKDAIRIYKTGIKATGTVPAAFHLGCFTESVEQSRKEAEELHPDLRRPFNNLTPQFCSEFCFKKGYKLAGVQRKSCYCTNKKLDWSKKTSGDGCNVVCAGDSAKKCGGAELFNFYATGLTDSPATGRSIACYDDGPNAESGQLLRALPDFRAELRETNSPQTCMNICYQLGFRFAGLQAGYECFCGMWRPDEKKLRAETECAVTCSGDPSEECGGNWRLQVYKTPLLDTQKDAAEYVGCYQDRTEDRLLSEFKESSPVLTPTSCKDLCFRGGYAFAGLHHSTECYCGHSQPAFVAKRPESECSKPCSGDAKLKCGDADKLSIYKTGFSALGNIPAGYYIGCFQEVTGPGVKMSDKLFHRFRQEFSSLSPKKCSEFCFKKGFKLAGVQAKVCHCTNKRLDVLKIVSDTECTIQCTSDGSKKCGGQKFDNLSVYATGLTDTPATGRLVGCYEDKPDKDGRLYRALPDFKADLQENNSPRTCLNICYQMGFRFAGLQAGFECFCGVWLPAQGKAKPDTQCALACTGDPSEKCGGHWHLQVYKTPLADSATAVQYPDPTPSTGSGTSPTSTATQQPPRPRPPTRPASGQTTRRTSAAPQKVTTPTPGVNCQLSTTFVNGKRACKNSVVFHDDFRQFDSNRWSHEIKIASKPDYEFTIFDAKRENTYVRDGALHIQPSIYDESFVENGDIRLDKCTGEYVNDECSRNTDYYILPPTQAARINTKQKFNFKYGIVDIQAKLPVGDWIVAEMWLMPADNVYGPYYESGKIGFIARGNSNLKYDDGREMGYQTVEGSAMIGYGTDVKAKAVYYSQKTGWRDQFHNFTIIWTPDDITFLVDGRRKQNVMVNAHGDRLSDVVGFPSSEIKLWNAGTTIAPFDQPFYIGLGLSVGGVRHFEDGAESNSYSKPWSNTDPRGMLKFWSRRNEWQRSWQTGTAFVIQSVKITAL